MWNVLVADDEPKIRRGLRTSIETLRSDMTVVAEAEDGETALALIEKTSPDILFIDVRMPFLNGLELIERIKERWRDCIIVIVSGHEEFEYAQKALQLKVFEYLLKPVSRPMLAEVLEKASVELTARRRQDRYMDWAREQLSRNMPLLKDQFMRDWVCARLARTEIQEQGDFLGLHLSAASAMVIVHVIERSTSSDLPLEKDRQLAALAVRGVVQDALRSLPLVAVFPDDQGDVIGVVGSVPDTEWNDAVVRIETQSTQSLPQRVVIVHKQVSQGTFGAAEIYDELKAEIFHKSGYRAVVVQAQNYIDAHFSLPELSLEDVAGAVQISPGYLSRLLKQETGFAFVDYLARVRINKAVLMMSNPAVKVYEVAEAVGYQSQHYFSRAFKRVFGRPPVQFRKGGSETGSKS